MAYSKVITQQIGELMEKHDGDRVAVALEMKMKQSEVSKRIRYDPDLAAKWAKGQVPKQFAPATVDLESVEQGPPTARQMDPNKERRELAKIMQASGWDALEITHQLLFAKTYGDQINTVVNLMGGGTVARYGKLMALAAKLDAEYELGFDHMGDQKLQAMAEWRERCDMVHHHLGKAHDRVEGAATARAKLSLQAKDMDRASKKGTVGFGPKERIVAEPPPEDIEA